MELTSHEQKILDIVNNHPEILDNPEKRVQVAELYGLSEKTLRNRIAELKKYGIIHPNNKVITSNRDIDIVQIFQLIWQSKLTIITYSFTWGVLAVLFLFIKTPMFTSTITMYPAGDLSQSKAVMGTNLSTIAESFGLAGLSPTPNYNIPDIVNSSRIKKEIILHEWESRVKNSKQSLITYWEIDQKSFSILGLIRSIFPDGNVNSSNNDKNLDIAIRELEDRITVSESGSGLITVDVDMEEPYLASEIANFVSDFVIKFVSKVQKTNAYKNRVFIEEQLSVASIKLKESEKILVQFKNQHPINLDTPDLAMSRMGLIRNIEENQTVYLTFRQQYEIARIDEQKEEILINILDVAVPAVKVSKPKKIFILLLAGFLGIGISIPVILYREYPSI